MAENAATKAFDWALKDTINMARVEAGSVASVKSFLTVLESDIIGILNSNKDISPGKKAKLETILTASSLAIDSAYHKIKATSADDLKGVAGIQSKGASKMINLGIGVDVMGAVLTESQLAAVASNTLVFGHSSGAWWGAQQDSLKFKFAAQMKQGYALGEDVDALVRRVRGTKANGFSDGIMAVSRREAEALVRSSIQTISNAASLESFAKMGDIVKGIEWVATLDTRTTKICRALDGKVWRTPDLQPVGHDKVFPGPTAHWNCRSRQIAVTRSWEELSGKKLQALDGATLQEKLKAKLKAKGMDDQKIEMAVANARASMDGQASGSPDMQKWLESRTDAQIKGMLGPSRAALFNAGKITVSDLTDQNNRPLTVAQLHAAIDAGEIPVETEGFAFTPYDATAAAKFEEPKQAVKVQESAQAKIDDVLANPKTLGNSILGANIAKIQAADPTLSPAEVLAKAEEVTAAKVAANTKSSVLSKAKKKLVAGEPTTAAQQAIIDDLGDDEKAAFLEAVADAKAVKDAEAIGAKAAAAALQKAKLKAEIDNQLAKPAGSLLSEDLVDVFNTEGLSADDIADLKSHLTAGVATKQASETLADWVTDPTKLKAINAAGTHDNPIQLLAAAQVKLGDLVATDVAGNTTAAAKKALKSLTGMNAPTDQSVAAWMKANGKNPEEFLAEFNAVTKEKLDASVKSSVLSKAKKKMAAGEGITPAQAKILQDLTPDEYSVFLQDVEAMKAKVAPDAEAAIATAAKAADEAATMAAAAAAAKTAAESRALAQRAATAARSAQANVPHPDELTIVSTLGGSTGAQLAKDKDGNRFVVKKGAEPDHVRSEMLADDLYRSLGLNVPDGALFETKGGPVKVTRFVDDAVPLASLTGKARAAAFKELQKGFAADAVLANWDVAGTGLDNVLVSPDGQVWRIDNGGALHYRAEGSTVGKNFNAYPDEFWTMREKGNIGGPIFGELDIFEISKQVEATDWKALESVPLADDLRKLLDQRIHEAKHFAGRALDFGHDGYTAPHADGVAKATLDVRQAGISSALPKSLKFTGSTTALVDENGRKFGALRDHSSTPVNAVPAAQKLPQDVFSDEIVKASSAMASAVNQAKDLNGSGTAMEKALKAIAHKPALTKLLTSSDPAVAEMAKDYLAQIAILEPMAKKGGVPTTAVPMFHPKTIAAAPVKVVAPPTASIVQQWEVMMKNEGIDITGITRWQKSQSGDSWSPETQAMKVAFAKAFADPEKAFYWDGPGGRTSYKTALANYRELVKTAGGEEKLKRLVTSWHAMTQEILSEIDSPWIDRKKRAVLLYRTVSQEELDGSFTTPPLNPNWNGKDKQNKYLDGQFTPRRGTTESHSIMTTFSYKGDQTTVQAVPFSRVLATFWAEQPGRRNAGGFAGDGEHEFAANTSGLQAIKSKNFKAPGYDDASKDATTWGVPLDHFRP